MTPATDPTLHSHQKAFLRHCRRNPKPLPILLRDRRLEPATLERWRTDPSFERAFQKSVRHLTRDTTTELRLALSVAMSLISREITLAHNALVTRDKAQPNENEPKLDPKDLKVCFDLIKIGDTLLFPRHALRKRNPGMKPQIPKHLLDELEQVQRKTLRTHFSTALADIGLPLPPDPHDLPAPNDAAPSGVVSSADHVPTPVTGGCTGDAQGVHEGRTGVARGVHEGSTTPAP